MLDDDGHARCNKRSAMSTPRIHPYLQLIAIPLALAAFPGAKNGCGSEEANKTLASPVQAVTTILERDDGTVDAELVLISTAVSPHAFVETAKQPQVRVPSGKVVALKSSSPGHYTASSGSSPGLVYSAGERYQFRFELDDEAAAKQVAGGSFVASATAPDPSVTFEVSDPPDFVDDNAEIHYAPDDLYALLTVRRPDGSLAYANFDFAEPRFEGDKWANLDRGGKARIPAGVLDVAGTYTLSLCAVSKVSDFDDDLSEELGVLSGFLIGRCAADQELEVIE